MNSKKSNRFSPEVRERAVRMVQEHRAKRHPFARYLVNSGRLSVPAFLHASTLNTPDVDEFDTPVMPGAPLPDAPVRVGQHHGWLLRQLGPEFTLLVFGPVPEWVSQVQDVQALGVGDAIEDMEGLIHQRLDGSQGAAYLIRPDQHVCARWRHPDPSAVQSTLDRASRRGRTAT